MDAVTFDQLTQRVATTGTRRAVVATTAALGAALLGLGARPSAAQQVEPAGNKCKGKNCNKNSNCGKGLTCKKGKCKYKNGNNKGSKGDTCCKNKDCKNNLKCKNKTCKKK